MVIALGDYVFDEKHTAAVEKYEEVGGHDARKVRLSGVICGKSAVADIEAALDAILAIASEAAVDTPLVLREGRRLWVRRVAFTREVSAAARTGAFTLDLEAPSPFEEAIEESTETWSVTASGDEYVVTSGGNAKAPLRIELVASGTVVAPRFSLGARSIAYLGVVEDGCTLVFDGASGRVTLDGVEVTAYASGEFPQLAPGGNTIVYTDEPASSHAASASLTWRNRWW